MSEPPLIGTPSFFHFPRGRLSYLLSKKGKIIKQPLDENNQHNRYSLRVGGHQIRHENPSASSSFKEQLFIIAFFHHECVLVLVFKNKAGHCVNKNLRHSYCGGRLVYSQETDKDDAMQLLSLSFSRLWGRPRTVKPIHSASRYLTVLSLLLLERVIIAMKNRGPKQQKQKPHF